MIAAGISIAIVGAVSSIGTQLEDGILRQARGPASPDGSTRPPFRLSRFRSCATRRRAASSPSPAAAASAGFHAAPSPTARRSRRSRACGRRGRRSAPRRFRQPPQRRAAQRLAAALGQRVGGAHAAQVVHQRERRCIAHGDAVDVGDRQREARALQQRAEIAQIGERRDARRDAAFDFGSRPARMPRAIRRGCRRRSSPRGTGRRA